MKIAGINGKIDASPQKKRTSNIENLSVKFDIPFRINSAKFLLWKRQTCLQLHIRQIVTENFIEKFKVELFYKIDKNSERNSVAKRS